MGVSLYQIWKLGDLGEYPEHTNNYEQAAAHFEDPATSRIDINMGVGKQVVARNFNDFEEFHQQLEYKQSMREPYEETMKRLSREDKELVAKLKNDPKIAKMCEASGLKKVDNNHRYDSIEMSLKSCYSLLRSIEGDVSKNTYEDVDKLVTQFDFISEQVRKLKEGK